MHHLKHPAMKEPLAGQPQGGGAGEGFVPPREMCRPVEQPEPAVPGLCASVGWQVLDTQQLSRNSSFTAATFDPGVPFRPPQGGRSLFFL